MVTIGQILKRERLRKKLTLQDAEKATKIKASFLDACEKGEYQRLPSSAYAQGFVTTYAEFLGIPRKEASALFRREFDEKRVYKVLPKSMTSQQEFSLKKRQIPNSVFIATAIVLLVGLYLFFQYRAALFNPPLAITSPLENQTLSGTSVVVSGSTDSHATVEVNGTEVAVDDNGNYKTTITLFPGIQNITVTAKNTFGKSSTVIRHVTLK